MRRTSRRVLVVDVGGTHVKVLATGKRVHRMFESGPHLTPQKLVAGVRALTSDWPTRVVSIGYPGPVRRNRPSAEPWNLGRGWAGFDFARAFGKPVRVVNDAAMQALGSYQGGRMLFLGLGTGLGAAMIVDGALAPLELSHLPYRRGKSYEHYVGLHGLKRHGVRRWRAFVRDVIERLSSAMQVDYVVLGGGNARLVTSLPKNVRRGSNENAFRGGFLLWQDRR
ncbi:MAG TPA: ROK family protein [Myxococcota bacterium]|nr:ROK family protein [Myxococcota bacterium]